MTKAYKLMFLSSLVMGTLISVSSQSWLGMWLGLEINLLSIIPLMQQQSSPLSVEASIKYFITQAMASTIILISIIMISMQSMSPSNIVFKPSAYLLMNSSLLTKMGTAPFHFWFPEVMEGLSWMNCLLILTWQKIAPMVLIMYSSKLSFLIISSSILAVIVGGILGINQTSLRKILAFSSINHMGWMLSTTLISETIWMFYFSIYTAMTINIILVLKKMKLFLINQILQALNSKPLIKFFFSLNFLSLAGIPPLIGFFPKWLTIQVLVQNEMFILPLTLIIVTLISIFMYIRIMISALVLNSNELTWKSTNKMSPISKFSISVSNSSLILSLILVTYIFNTL